MRKIWDVAKAICWFDVYLAFCFLINAFRTFAFLWIPGSEVDMLVSWVCALSMLALLIWSHDE